MAEHRRGKVLEKTIILILLGMLAGGIGGAAIGFVTGRPPSSTTGQ